MMVLIPILFTAAVFIVCLHTSLGSYWYTLEAMYSDENGIQFAQSMIYTYQQELWENNWGQGGNTNVSGEIMRSDEMNHLEDKIDLKGSFCMGECTNNGVCVCLDGERFKVTPLETEAFFNREVMKRLEK